MSYTIPNGDSLSFSFSGQPAYTPPSGDSLTFSFVPTAATGGPLALAARAALALVGQAHLVSMALKPLRAVGALSVRAIGIMRSLGTLMLKALARIGLVGKRTAAERPAGPRHENAPHHRPQAPGPGHRSVPAPLVLGPAQRRQGRLPGGRPAGDPARRHLGESRAPPSPPSCASRAPRSPATVAPTGSRCRPGSRSAPPPAPGPASAST